MEEQFFRCPLTNLIFHDPVVAEDGYFYEFLAIKDWLLRKKTSPITNEPMGEFLQPVKHFSNMINKYLEENPQLIDDRFYNKKPFYLFHDDFIGSILKNEFNRLVNYTDILINDTLWEDDEADTICGYLFINCKETDIIKKIIDNSIDYDSENYKGTRPIHLACKYANEDVIKYLIEKNVNLDCEDEKGNKPIHYITKYQDNSSDITTYFIEKNQTMDTFNEDGLLPIHLIVQNMSSWDNLKPFLESNCNLDIYSKEGLKPIHYVCRDCKDPQLIKEFLSLNIDLEATTADCDELTCDELMYSNTSLEKSEKQKLVYFYLDKLLKKIDIDEEYMS